MNFAFKLLIAVSLGVPAGFFGRELLHKAPDRVDAAIALFEDFCVPVSLSGVQPSAV